MSTVHQAILVATTMAVLPASVKLPAAEPTHRKLSAVPFTAVQLSDAFWTPRMKVNRETSLPHNFVWCEKTGRISNFAKAGGLEEDKFMGIYFNDSDVYKVLQGAAYSLADQRNPELERTVDDVIRKIAAAQQPNGYLNSYYTLVEPDKKWTNLQDKHELYCAGHLFEAAVAHHRATGKQTLLDVAVAFADRIDELFGSDARHGVPGHEEIELALVKLYELTGERRYFDLARFFIDMRGNQEERPRLYGPYSQDHKPVREQDEVVGHAVRAMYLYAGMADVAAHTGDCGLIDAMDRLWDDVVRRKMYITGGIGARHRSESFGHAYELPNDSAYCETCAAIGLVLWSHRMNLLHADAEYVDVLERALYNGILSGVSLDGAKFFYVNPLASQGNHHRKPFYGCACCPTNVVRTIPSVPGYVYAVADDAVHVNLYAAGKAKLKVNGTDVTIQQQTKYPWQGAVTLRITPAKPVHFDLCLRVPAWSNALTVAVNDRSATPEDATPRKGYVHIDRDWQPGDTVELALPMDVRRVAAHPKVEADHGRVALRRGPIVYCFEKADNPDGVDNITLPNDAEFEIEHRDDLLGGVTVIHTTTTDGRRVTAIPYYAWDHRQPGPMVVWVEQAEKADRPDAANPTWHGKLYRTYTQ